MFNFLWKNWTLVYLAITAYFSTYDMCTVSSGPVGWQITDDHAMAAQRWQKVGTAKYWWKLMKNMFWVKYPVCLFYDKYPNFTLLICLYVLWGVPKILYVVQKWCSKWGKNPSFWNALSLLYLLFVCDIFSLAQDSLEFSTFSITWTELISTTG